MKRIYSTLLVVLAITLGSTVAFGQQQPTTGFDQVKGKQIGIFAFGNTIHVKAEAAKSGVVEVYNISGKLVAKVAVEGSETLISIDGTNQLYIVKAVVDGKAKVGKVVIK